MTKLDIGTAERRFPGETVCGDSHVVVSNKEGVRIGVADGLGHGPEASIPARLFCETVSEQREAPIQDVFMAANRKLAGTRGAAAAILSFSVGDRSVEYGGVGNVELRSYTATPLQTLNTRAIVGQSLRRLTTFRSTLSYGDVFILFTDGISEETACARNVTIQAQPLADRLLNTFASNRDDATCVVVRCLF